MCPPQVPQPQQLENAPNDFSCRNLMRNREKDAPCLPLNWVRRESLDSPCMGQVDSIPPQKLHALTLNKCALTAGTCITVAED
jgi:hypothetical protein